MQKYRAKAFFSKKMGICQSGLSVYLTYGTSNPKVEEAIQKYLSMNEKEKESFFEGFQEKKESKILRKPVIKNPLLCLNDENEVDLKKKIEERLPAKGISSISMISPVIIIASDIEAYNTMLKEFVEEIRARYMKVLYRPHTGRKKICHVLNSSESIATVGGILKGYRWYLVWNNLLPLFSRLSGVCNLF